MAFHWPRSRRHPASGVPQPTPRRRNSRRRRRQAWWVGIGLVVVLGLGFWLLPAIVAYTPLCTWLAARATADLNGSVSIGAASLGWLSPVRLRAVELRDTNGQTVFQANELTTAKPLAELLLNWNDLGAIHLKEPRLTLVTRDDGSNLEDVLAEYFQREPSGYRPAFQLDFAGGSATLADLPTAQTWQLDDVRLLCVRPAGQGEPWRIEVSAQVAGAGRAVSTRGKLRVAAQYWPLASASPAPAAGASADSTGEKQTERLPRAVLAAQPSSESERAEAPAATGGAQGQPGQQRLGLSIDAERVPLAVLRPLLARVMPGARLGGEMSGKALVRWPAQAGSPCVVKAEVVADGFALGAAMFGADRFWLPRFEAECRAQGTGKLVQIAALRLSSELGELHAQGAICPRSFGAERRWWDKLLSQELELGGRVDLARLAATLPHTLRIRQDTQITGGELVFELISQPRGEPPGWQGRLATTGLRANHAGRELVWEKPIELNVAARRTAEAVVVDELVCQSDFLQLRGAGNLNEAALSGEFDLAKLAIQLGQFVELGQLRLAGQGWTHLAWKRQGDGQAAAEAEFQVRDLEIHHGGRRLIGERELVAFLTAGVQSDPGSGWQLRSAALEVQVGGEMLQARLLEPPAAFSARVPWKLWVELRSRLDRWSTRLAGWWDAAEGALDGTGELTGRLIVGLEQVRLEQATVHLTDLRWQRGALRLAEPQAELVLTAAWQRAQRRWQLEDSHLSSAAADLQADALSIYLPKDAWPEIEGVLNYRVDTGRLASWWAEPRTPPAWNAAGRLTGSARLIPAPQGTAVDAEADLTNLVLVHRSGFKWEEPLVHASLQGLYQPNAKLLQIESLKMTAASLAAQAAGQLTATAVGRAQSGETPLPRMVSVAAPAAGANQVLLALDGRVGYDWARLNPLLQAGLGPGVKLQGQFTSPANWHGPLDLARAQAQAELEWQRADLYGFVVGPGACRARLGEAELVFEPMELAVNQGRLRLAPKVQFAPPPAVLTLPAGLLVDRVQVTPEMCAAALQYVAPVLAEATSVQGSFSIELDHCQIPLQRPALGRMAGRMTIHSMEVGPGPLIEELAVALGRAKPGRLRRESIIRFVMADGGVHHEGLELEFPELTIRTRGFVGFDRSLALVVEMPVPEKWLIEPRVRAALANQTVTLPLRGTLSRPQLDRQALQEANRRMLREAARNAVENEILNQLQRLLGPPP